MYFILLLWLTSIHGSHGSDPPWGDHQSDVSYRARYMLPPSTDGKYDPCLAITAVSCSDTRGNLKRENKCYIDPRPTLVGLCLPAVRATIQAFFIPGSLQNRECLITGGSTNEGSECRYYRETTYSSDLPFTWTVNTIYFILGRYRLQTRSCWTDTTIFYLEICLERLAGNRDKRERIITLFLVLYWQAIMYWVYYMKL